MATTLTSYLSTTIVVTSGQRVTLSVPKPDTEMVISTPAMTISTATVTHTQMDVIVADSETSIFATLTIPVVPSQISEMTSAATSSGITYILDARETECEGTWDCWSRAERAGLISGVILAFFILLALLWCCTKKWNVWVVSGWNQPIQGLGPVAAGTTQPALMNGSLTPANVVGTAPYLYPYAYEPRFRGGGVAEEDIQPQAGMAFSTKAFGRARGGTLGSARGVMERSVERSMTASAKDSPRSSPFA